MPEGKPQLPEPVPPEHILAAKKGCAQCYGRVRIPPAGAPFPSGLFAGRYLCADCWTLIYEQNPDYLADESTKKFIMEEAQRIRLRRKASILYEEGPNKVFMSARGTLVVEIKSAQELAPLEFDSQKLAWFMKALAAIQSKMPAIGSELVLK